MTKQQKKPGRNSRPVATASAILDRALQHARLQNKIREYAAFPEWETIVGEEIAKVARPEKILRGKILVVRVVDAAWAQELSMQKSMLLDRIFEHKLGATIEDIQFLSGNPKSLK